MITVKENVEIASGEYMVLWCISLEIAETMNYSE
jgi:hypothetical protein